MRDTYNGELIIHPLRFEARLQVRADGGKVTMENNRIKGNGANSATLILAAATSFQRFSERHADPAKACLQALADVKRKDYAKLRSAHVADHQRLFRRVSLDLGGSNKSNFPTDEAVAARFADNDPGLAPCVSVWPLSDIASSLPAAAGKLQGLGTRVSSRVGQQVHLQQSTRR